MYKEILHNEDDFIFNILDIENYNNRNSRMRFFFNYIRENHKNIKGDIYEFGVFNGRNLIALGLLLKKLKSKKKIYGFDTFKGFPKYSPYDQLDYFKKLFDEKFISKKHYEKHLLLIDIKKLTSKNKSSVKNISKSTNFTSIGKNNLLDKIKLLQLDNIVLVEGDFKKSVPQFFSKKKRVFSASIDCDLYDGYKVVLPFLWDNIEEGGYIHLDEYYSIKFPGARKAVNEFCSKSSIKAKKHQTPPGEFERWYLKK